MLTEVESDKEPSTANRPETLLTVSCDSVVLRAEGPGAASSSVRGRRIVGGNGSRASFSTKCQMSDGDCRSLFSYRPSAFETAVDICQKSVIVPKLDGKPLDAWLVTEIDHWNFEKEKIVLLTENSFLIVKFDFIKQAVSESRRINFLSIHKIQVGDLTYPRRSLMKSRDCGGVRIHFGDERALGLRHRWNPFSSAIPYCTFIHHPLIYNKNETNTLIYNVDHMTETVKYGVEMALKRSGHERELAIDEGPILVQSYAGLSSALFNQSHIGFSKERGPVNF